MNEEGLIVDISTDVTCLNDACTEHSWNEANLRKKRKQGPLLGKNTLLMTILGGPTLWMTLRANLHFG